MQNIFLTLIFLLIAACGRAPDVSSPAPFEASKLNNASSAFCTAPLVLKEAALPTNSRLEHLARDNQVFGFFIGDKGCALNHSIYQKDFELIFTSACIPNGSLWKQIDYFVLGSRVEWILESLDTPKHPSKVRIRGERSMGSSAFRQKTGLRPISCQ